MMNSQRGAILLDEIGEVGFDSRMRRFGRGLLGILLTVIVLAVIINSAFRLEYGKRDNYEDVGILTYWLNTWVREKVQSPSGD